MKLTERQIDVLRELEAAIRVNAGTKRITTMLCGGTDGSYHSAVLAQLCRKGLASRRKVSSFGNCTCKCGHEAMFGHRCKGEFWYGITKEGKRALAELR